MELLTDVKLLLQERGRMIVSANGAFVPIK
jgi:hypothetical protein